MKQMMRIDNYRSFEDTRGWVTFENTTTRSIMRIPYEDTEVFAEVVQRTVAIVKKAQEQQRARELAKEKAREEFKKECE